MRGGRDNVVFASRRLCGSRAATCDDNNADKDTHNGDAANRNDSVEGNARIFASARRAEL